MTLPAPEITSIASRELSVDTAGKWSLKATWRCENASTLKSFEPWETLLPSYAETRTVALCPVVSTKPKLKR